MTSQYGELRPVLAAEICWRVWNTPGNFNGFHVLAGLLHGTLVVGDSQTFLLFSSHRSQIGCLPYFHTWCGLSVNLEFRMHVWNVLHAASRKYRTQNYPKIAICAPSYNTTHRPIHSEPWKRDILFLTITLANLNRFLQFVYHFHREEILHATVVKFTTSP